MLSNRRFYRCQYMLPANQTPGSVCDDRKKPSGLEDRLHEISHQGVTKSLNLSVAAIQSFKQSTPQNYHYI